MITRVEIREAAANAVSPNFGAGRVGRKRVSTDNLMLYLYNILRDLPEDVTVRELREAMEDG